MKTIIMICGKSAAGKDTLAKRMNDYFHSLSIDSRLTISDTTRPARRGEKYGVDYYFTEESILDDALIDYSDFLEYNYFNGWFYGTRKSEIEKADVSIMVLNPAGVFQVYKQFRHESVNMYIVYLDINMFTRMRRSIEREHGIKLEFLRRLIADEKDFKDFKYKCTKECFGIVREGNFYTLKKKDDMDYFIITLANKIKYGIID